MSASLIPLNVEAMAEHGATHVFVFDHTDLTETTVNTAQTLDVVTLGAGQTIEGVKAKLLVDFQDASDAAFNTTPIELGDSGDADRLLASMELNVNGTEVDVKAGTGTIAAPTTSTTYQVTVGSMIGKSLSNIDAGKAEVYVKISK